MKLSFDELRKLIDDSAGRAISAYVRNRSRRYYFDRLKPTVSYNPDCCGVSINHSHQPQHWRRSRFHDEEDIAIDFERQQFKRAEYRADDDQMYVNIECSTFSTELRIELCNE